MFSKLSAVIAALLVIAHPWLIAAAFGVAVLAAVVLVLLLARKIAREGASCLPRPAPAPRY